MGRALTAFGKGTEPNGRLCGDSLHFVVWHTHPLDVNLLTGIVESDHVLFVLDRLGLRRRPTVPLPLTQPLCHRWGTQGEIFSV
jgi:hypothetical protein